MTCPVDEIKIRARLLCKGLDRQDTAALDRARGVAKRQRWAVPQTWTLGLCLNVVSVEAGFDQWDHARKVLAGEAGRGSDMGRFWYDKTCWALLNLWFASYEDARESLRECSGRYLFPYGRQYIVADGAFVQALGLDPASPGLAGIGGDLAGGYGSPAWQEQVEARLRHTRTQAARA